MDIKDVLSDKDSRIYACEQSFRLYVIAYFSQFLKFPFAGFHNDFFRLLQDDSITELALLAFRESAKTVFTAIFYPSWCICYNKRNFIEFVGADHTIATKRLKNLATQLQTNQAIINDFGNLYFEPTTRQERHRSKRISYFETTNDISCVALGINQSPRGDLFNVHRPDLLIGDDIDNMKTVKNPKMRKETRDRLHGEFMGGLADNARSIISGNMTHRDCLMANLDKRPDVWQMVKVPVKNDEGQYAWASRWNYQKEQRMKNKLGISVWNQEYMLKPIGDEDQIILEAWIQHYNDKINHLQPRYKVVCAVDPAVKEKESSDYTAIEVWCKDEITGNAHCLEYVKKRMPIEKIMYELKRLFDYYQFDTLGVEDVAAQHWLIQLIRSTYPEIPVKSIKRITDKASRLRSVQYLFQSKKIFFRPQQQEVIDELVDFPVAPHDDLVDACVDCLHLLFRTTGTRLIQSNTTI